MNVEVIMPLPGTFLNVQLGHLRVGWTAPAPVPELVELFDWSFNFDIDTAVGFVTNQPRQA